MAVVRVASVEQFVGLSSDTKPAAARAGSRYYETDTGQEYVFDGTAWQPVGRVEVVS